MIHTDPAWNDDLAIPLGLIATYIDRLERGRDDRAAAGDGRDGA